MNKNEILLLLTERWCDWEAAYAIAVANSFSEYTVKTIAAEGIPIAAICGATTYLCRHGFLNHVKHTGDSLELFRSQDGYTGQELYVSAQVVADGGFITANETAAVEFAYEIFKLLKVDSDARCITG